MRIVVLFLALAGLFAPHAAAEEQPLALDRLAQTLQEAASLQATATPKGLLSKRGPFDKGGYDPNKLLELFPGLSLDKGKILDFVYDLQDLGGHPVVYARSSDQEPFAGLPEFKKAHPRRYFLGDKVRFDPAWLGSVRTENSPDGFLRLAFLVLINEQFYIHWHAAYYVLWPIVSRVTLEAAIRMLPDDLKQKAAAIGFTPRVVMGGSEVTVEYVIFCPWEGFKRFTWTVARTFPHRFIRIEEKVLLPYKNPIRF